MFKLIKKKTLKVCETCCDFQSYCPGNSNSDDCYRWFPGLRQCGNCSSYNGRECTLLPKSIEKNFDSVCDEYSNLHKSKKKYIVSHYNQVFHKLRLIGYFYYKISEMDIVGQIWQCIEDNKPIKIKLKKKNYYPDRDLKNLGKSGKIKFNIRLHYK